MQEIKELLIQDPMIVAQDSGALLLVSRADATLPVDTFAQAQLYEPDQRRYSPVLPFGSFGKFLYSIEEVNPPQPFDKDALRQG